MFEITLTFAEEEFGLSYADLPLCWSDLHLDGSWAKKKRDRTKYTLVSGSSDRNGDTGAKHNRARLKIKLLCLLKRTTIFQAYAPWIQPWDEIFMLARVQHLHVQMDYESKLSTRTLWNWEDVSGFTRWGYIIYIQVLVSCTICYICYVSIFFFTLFIFPGGFCNNVATVLCTVTYLLDYGQLIKSPLLAVSLAETLNKTLN